MSEEIELLQKQINKLEDEKNKELDSLLVPFKNARNKLYESLNNIHNSALKGVNDYNSRSFFISKNEQVKVVFKPLKLDVTPDFENIFNNNLEKIKQGAYQFNRLTNTNLSSFLGITNLIGPAINQNQYILDNFDKFYDSKYKESEKEEYYKKAVVIENKYNEKINDLKQQINDIENELASKINEAYIGCSTSLSDDVSKVVIGFKNDTHEPFIYQDLKGKGNILYHANSNSKYPFIKDLMLQYFDKIGDKNIEIVLVGDMPTDIAGLSILLKKSSTNPNSISEVHRLSYADAILTELIEKLENRASRYIFDGDFFEFNKNNQSNKDPYIIVIIDDVTSMNEDCKRKIEQLAVDGNTNGIFTVIISDDKYNETYNDECIKFNSDDYNFIEFDCFDEKNCKYNDEVVNLNLQPKDFNLKTFLDSLSNRKIDNNTYISFNDIVNDENNIDTSSFSRKITIPVGKTGPSIKNITFDVLGSGESFMIVAGTTGSGKSEFLHTMILDSAYLYNPKQLQFYLIDFKDGVEFGPYIDKYSIPHIKLISRKNTIDDALTILQKIQTIFERRNDLIRQGNYKDIISYNEDHKDNPISRLFIVIDEYQVLLNGGTSNSNSRIASQCEEILKDIVKRGRTAGISLILASQVNACGKEILSQISHRVVFKSEGVLTGLIESLPYSAEKELNGLPKGSAYHTSNGKDASIFRSAYIPNKSKDDKEISKDKIVRMIREKYPSDIYPTNIIVSNDETIVNYDDKAIQDDRIIDLGISVFDNEHVTMRLSHDTFSNYIILGDNKKNYDIEAAILKSKYVTSNDLECNLYCSPKSYDFFNNNLNDIKVLKSLNDLHNVVSELYLEMVDRRKQSNKGIDISKLNERILIINDFDYKQFSDYFHEEDNDSSSSSVDEFGLPIDLSFLGGGSSKSSSVDKTLIDMIKEIYSQSYKYGIYLFIHSDTDKNLDGIFDYQTKGYFEYGFYLNKEAVNYYLEKTSYSSRKVDIEKQNSVYVNGDNYIKFKRYNFEEK